MKIVKQSFEILPEHTDPVKQIAERSRICYKSEDKAKDDERPFLTRIMKHEPVFEMAVVSLLFKFGGISHNTILTKLDKNNYIHVSELISDGEDSIIATGSVRAWQEFIKTTECFGLRNAVRALNNYNDFLFNYGTENYQLKSVTVITDLASLGLSHEDLKKHIHVAVKFTTNRAVSHELVRHRPCAFLQESQRYCRYDNEVVFIDPRPAFDIFTGSAFKKWEWVCSEAELIYLDLLEQGASPQAARTVLPNSCKTEIIVYCNLKEWEHIFNRRVSAAAEPSMREQMVPLHAKFKEMFPGYFDKPKLSVG